MSEYNVQGVVRTWDEDKAELERLRSLLQFVREHLAIMGRPGDEAMVDAIDKALS